MGALTQLWAGTTEEGGKQSGKVRPKNPLRERRPTLIHFFFGSYAHAVLGPLGTRRFRQEGDERSRDGKEALGVVRRAGQGCVNSPMGWFFLFYNELGWFV
jgi:hypothetical protein